MYMLAIFCLVSVAVALPVENLTPPPNLDGKVDNIVPVEGHDGKIESIPLEDKFHASLKEPKELEPKDDSKIVDKPKEFKKEENTKKSNKDQDSKELKKDDDFKEPKKDADFKDPKKDADFKEPKKGNDFKEPKKGDDFKELKKDDDFKEPKEDKDSKEFQKEKDSKESNKGYDSKDIDEHKNPAPEEPKKDFGNDKFSPVIEPKKPSGLSGLINWIFNLFPFNPFSSSQNGARSDFDDQPIIQYKVDPSDADALNLLK